MTINSLFYNLHTGLIEDFTEKGLSDLKLGIIRTPLPSKETFKDDPLRLLRCIRFSTRFNFNLDFEIFETVKTDSIKVALMEKISRERVGIEIDKMLQGRDPLSSLKLIHELGLYLVVFRPPSDVTRNSIIDSSLAIKTAQWLNQLITLNHSNLSLHPLLMNSLASSTNIRRRLFLACALTPFQNLKVKLGKREVWAGEVCISDSLKLGNHDKTFVTRLFQALNIVNTSHFSALQKNPTSLRTQLGQLLRSPIVHDLKQLESLDSSSWQASFVFGLVIELSQLDSNLNSTDQELAQQLIQKYNKLVDKIIELGLPLILTPEFDKRRLDGNEICQLMNIKPGKQVAAIITRLIERQIEFPDQTKQEGAEWLQEEVKSGRLVI
ncbi:hypothetical protein O181_101718 [Austropuccinia psidii MF-1]|uniref:tRNA nucleotidyltransferase/poly(A) polymerase RNA and SrmB- binding domain-containing protein n=1 Tax=Austropuccinia psidii MF-1 TaxID=1389203 RepID=A0A9Q3JH36_9BASI|nr:hypothetical protein [Austropuccinia psidii MF-1]